MGKKESNLFLRPDGSVEGLYTDLVDLRCLGRLEVRRASFVEFDMGKQAWQVTLPSGEVLGTYASREDALASEIAILEARMAKGGRI